MARVDLKNIVGRYGDFLAVDNVNLTIESGQFVTLLGPSGCGKSSTLRIVAGLLKPSSGQVEFDGRDVTNLAAAKRNIGMVFQSLALFPHMTVAENVAFGLKMKRVPAEESTKQVKRILEIVRLDHLAHRYPAQMSGGQQQRVALARAMVIKPGILILDEPFGALDRKLREAMQMELHALTR
jgi:ABC-type Fe3+/spermidine/putrescine transport system ATPase subunit